MNFEEFWTRGDLHERVNIALKEANLLEKKLEIEDLFPLDQYHARGIAATIELADKLNFTKNSTIIDIGCGLGGPARYFSKRFNCIRWVSISTRMTDSTLTANCHHLVLSVSISHSLRLCARVLRV